MKRQDQHPELKKKLNELSISHNLGIDWWWEFQNILDDALIRENYDAYDRGVDAMTKISIESINALK
mgnify:CR=1 FL=1|tara:strand:- start:312 stop:512 length:201 start_codon:yes stop_codon:yes gene_type:complete